MLNNIMKLAKDTHLISYKCLSIFDLLLIKAELRLLLLVLAKSVLVVIVYEEKGLNDKVDNMAEAANLLLFWIPVHAIFETKER